MSSASLDPLTRLAIKYGSDKFGSHLYTPIYHQLFGHLRDKPIRFLEIGIGGYDLPMAGGLSLRMWADYFPNAHIVGLDIHPKKLDIAPHVQTICGSQSDPNILAQLTKDFGPFDIIIDDGSHKCADAKASFLHLYPHMTSNGIYAVEDIQTSFAENYGGNRVGSGSMFETAYRLSLIMHQQEGYLPRAEDQMLLAFGALTHSVQIFRNQIIFTRGSNTYPSVRVLDFKTSDVQEIYALLENEARDNPSPGNYLTRIDMNIWGQRLDVAVELALKGAEDFPDQPAFLTELIRLMLWAQKPNAMEIIRQKLLPILQK